MHPEEHGGRGRERRFYVRRVAGSSKGRIAPLEEGPAARSSGHKRRMNPARVLRGVIHAIATCKRCGRRIPTKSPEFQLRWAQIRDNGLLTPTRGRRISGDEVCPECQTSDERRGTRVVHLDY
jgi:hypothetical protein